MEEPYHSPLVITETVSVVDDGSPPMSTALQLVELVLTLERLVRLVAVGQLLQLDQGLGWLAAVARRAPLVQGFTVTLDVDLAEDPLLIIRTRDDLVDFIVVHITSLLILLLLVGFEDGTLRAGEYMRWRTSRIRDVPRTPLAPPVSTCCRSDQPG